EALTAAFGEQGAQIRSIYIYREDFREMFGPPTERAVIDARILNERANELGVVVTDKAITEFLRKRTEDKVNADEFGAIVKQFATTHQQVYDALRVELAARQFPLMVLTALQPTPAERWEYFQR